MCRGASPSDNVSRTALHEHFARLAHGAGNGMEGAAMPKAAPSGGSGDERFQHQEAASRTPVGGVQVEDPLRGQPPETMEPFFRALSSAGGGLTTWLVPHRREIGVHWLPDPDVVWLTIIDDLDPLPRVRAPSTPKPSNGGPSGRRSSSSMRKTPSKKNISPPRRCSRKGDWCWCFKRRKSDARNGIGFSAKYAISGPQR